MKILFNVTNFGFLRNFQSTIALLAQRKHHVHLVADRFDNTGGMQMVTALAAANPGITWAVSAPVKRGLWFTFTSVLRLTLDYWRYLDPRFADAVMLRTRAERQVPRLVVWLPRLTGKAGWRFMTRVARWMERAIPVRPEVVDLLRREQPDALLLTPLLYFGSRQVDHVRAARAAGIPSILGVGSWDHLTTKGVIHEIPDFVAVWNERQKAEAVTLHDVPPDRVVVTGAQAYDHWFERSVSTTRQDFCARVGVAGDRPFLLYLCSSPFITPHEVPFVRRWIEAIRSSGSEPLRGVGLLVRPHPQNAEQWRDVELSGYGNVAVWPRAGANPIDADARAEYFDSMFHSHAVVGVNTSALIESGIVGRRVYSILVDEFSSTQEGTLHFQHLKGGLLQLASTLEAHTAQLAPTLEGASTPDEARTVRGFVEAFIRPHGLDVAATPRFAALVEQAGSRRLPPQPAPAWAPVVRALELPLAFAMMVANIDRDRWWSFLLHATRPPRHALRAGWGWTRKQIKMVLRSRVLTRPLRLAAHAVLTRGHKMRRAARRLMGGTQRAE